LGRSVRRAILEGAHVEAAEAYQFWLHTRASATHDTNRSEGHAKPFVTALSNNKCAKLLASIAVSESNGTEPEDLGKDRFRFSIIDDVK